MSIKERTVSLPVNWPSEANKSNKTGALASAPLINLCLAFGNPVNALKTLKLKTNKTKNSSTGGTRSNGAESFRGSVLKMNRHKNIALSSAIHNFFCRYILFIYFVRFFNIFSNIFFCIFVTF